MRLGVGVNFNPIKRILVWYLYNVLLDKLNLFVLTIFILIDLLFRRSAVQKNNGLKKTGGQEVNYNLGVSEILINKKIVYSTEHFIEMAITETKTKEETITDLMLDIEESSKDKAETQDKTIPKA